MNSNGRGGTADFRLKTTSLERVVNMIQRHKQSRKLGRYEVDTILRIQVCIRTYMLLMCCFVRFVQFVQFVQFVSVF